MDPCDCDLTDCGFHRLASGHVAQLRSLSRSKTASKIEPSEEDSASEDDYGYDESKSFVDRQLEASLPLPPVTWSTLSGRIIWFNLITVALTPVVSFYGIFTTRATSKTVIFSIAYYVWNMLGMFPPVVEMVIHVEV